MSGHEQGVVEYYQSWESRLGYRVFLGGEKHLGLHEGETAGNDRAARKCVMDEAAKELFGHRKTAGKRVLDAGCGLGAPSRYISRKHDIHVDGISIVPFEVKTSRRKAVKSSLDCSYELMSYDSLKYPDETFDGVYTIETLFHAQKPLDVLKEFYRTLKPGGRVVLFEYTMASDNKFSKEEKQLSDFAIDVGAGHGMRWLRHGSFGKLLKQADFVDVAVEDRTKSVMPSLLRLHRHARWPSKVLRKLGLAEHFGNTLVADSWYELYEKKLWRYVVVSAAKPKKKL